MGLLNHHKPGDEEILELLHSNSRERTLADCKREIEIVQRLEKDLQDELKEKWVEPLYNDLEKLQELVCTLPEGMTKFMAHMRIEELKR